MLEEKRRVLIKSTVKSILLSLSPRTRPTFYYLQCKMDEEILCKP